MNRGKGWKRVAKLITSRYESMMATLKMIREKFGGAERYLMDVIGLTPEEVEAIKRNLIVDEPAIHRF